MTFITTPFKHIFSALVLIGAAFISCPSNASSRFWVANVATGPILKDSAFRYYLEEQIRFADGQYKFNEFFFIPGLGYALSDAKTLFAGLGYIYTKDGDGDVFREFRVWQQLSWRIRPWLHSRTRLEERRMDIDSSFGLRLRQRLWMKLPLSTRKQIYFSAFDEVFFNLNHPFWVSPKLFSQNRMFVGLNKQLTQSTIVDCGYLNQRLMHRTNQINHVFLVMFTMNF